MVELESRISSSTTLVAKSCYNNDHLLSSAYSLLFSDGPLTCSTLLDSNITQTQALQGIADFQQYASICVIPLLHTTIQYEPERIDDMIELTQTLSNNQEVYIGDVCPETCGWLCDSSTFKDQCEDSIMCLTEIDALKERVNAAEDEVDEIASCHDSVAIALESLTSDLNHWIAAVQDGGLSCRFVPSQFCESISSCTISDGQCT